MPQRLQRKRVRGWRKPAGAVYIGRPTKWGNPFKWTMHGRAEVVRLYREWLLERVVTRRDPVTLQTLEYGPRYMHLGIEELRGKDLLCFCPEGESCHGDVLIELANR